MLSKLGRVLGALIRWAREREPLTVISGLAATIVAVVGEWQGDLSGDAAWLAVAWGLATFLARRHVTPAANPAPPTRRHDLGCSLTPWHDGPCARADGGAHFVSVRPSPWGRAGMLALALALALTLVAPAEPASAETYYLPLYDWAHYGTGDCHVMVRHGNYGSAFAEVREHGGYQAYGCSADTGVRVTAAYNGAYIQPPAGCSFYNGALGHLAGCEYLGDHTAVDPPRWGVLRSSTWAGSLVGTKLFMRERTSNSGGNQLTRTVFLTPFR